MRVSLIFEFAEQRQWMFIFRWSDHGSVLTCALWLFRFNDIRVDENFCAICCILIPRFFEAFGNSDQKWFPSHFLGFSHAVILPLFYGRIAVFLSPRDSRYRGSAVVFETIRCRSFLLYCTRRWVSLRGNENARGSCKSLKWLKNVSLLSLAVRAVVLPGNQTTEGYKYNRANDLKIIKIYKGRTKLHKTRDFRVASQNITINGDLENTTINGENITINGENVTINGENFTINQQIGLFAKAYAVALKPLRSSMDYLLAGSIRMEKIQLNLGSWIQPWSEVTLEQRAGIRGIYARNCQCQITPCFGKPGCDQLLKGCNVSAEHFREFYLRGCEWRYSYCLKNSQETTCSWHETAVYKNCTNPGLP